MKYYVQKTVFPCINLETWFLFKISYKFYRPNYSDSCIKYIHSSLFAERINGDIQLFIYWDINILSTMQKRLSSLVWVFKEIHEGNSQFQKIYAITSIKTNRIKYCKISVKYQIWNSSSYNFIIECFANCLKNRFEHRF